MQSSKPTVWDEGAAWPKASSQYVFLAAAFDEAGRAMYPGEWTGKEGAPLTDPWAVIKKIDDMLKQQEVTPASRLRSGAHLLRTPRPAQQSVISDEARAGAVSGRQKMVADAQAGDLVNNAMAARRDAVAAWLAAKGRDDELKTYGMIAVAGATLEPLPPTIWNGADDLPTRRRRVAYRPACRP